MITISKSRKRTRTIPRLHFSEEDRSKPTLKRPIAKVDKASDKLDKTQKKLPGIIRKTEERTVELASARTKVRLHFEEVQRPRAPSGVLRPLSNSIAMETHRQVSEAEKENAGVESGHRAEQTVESATNGVQRAHRSRKLKAHRQSVLAERQLDQANKRYLQRKGAGNRLSAARSHPASRIDAQHNGNPLSRWLQKHAIKREYTMLRSGKGASSMGSNVKAGQTVTQTAAQTANKTGKALSMAAEKLMAFVSRNSSGIMTALGVFLLMAVMMNALASCTQIAIGSLDAVLSSSYSADDQDICNADIEMTRLEAELEQQILNAERSHPNCDEYRYAIDPIGHDPFELIAYLTARYEAFRYSSVRSDIHGIFSEMYMLTFTKTTETRYRTETRTYTYWYIDPVTKKKSLRTGTEEVQVAYNYNIMDVNLRSRMLTSVVLPWLTPEQQELFVVYMETRGNRSGFANPLPFPWQSYVIRPYGCRLEPSGGGLQMHRGLDLGAAQGTPIHAIHKGKVIRADYDTDFGNIIVIEDKDGYRSTYAHCGIMTVSSGQDVARGQEIGTVGSTGGTFVSNLHLELMRNGEYLNPTFYIDGTDPYVLPISGGGNNALLDYEIPPELLQEKSFASLIQEGEKYLGYPYVWGGSTPQTSFDCSGFVCWVYSNSGVFNLPRTTAQGIYDQCTILSPSAVKPGDLVFFTRTYNSIGPVSHVAIYVGNGMMLHAGKPISYASMNTSYWQNHFYAYGRLPITRR